MSDIEKTECRQVQLEREIRASQDTQDYLRAIFYRYQRARIDNGFLYDLWCDAFDEAVEAQEQ